MVLSNCVLTNDVGKLRGHARSVPDDSTISSICRSRSLGPVGSEKIVSLHSKLNGHFPVFFPIQTLSLSGGSSNVRVNAIDEEIHTEANQKHQA